MELRGRTRAQINFSLLWRLLIMNTVGKYGVTWKKKKSLSLKWTCKDINKRICNAEEMRCRIVLPSAVIKVWICSCFFLLLAWVITGIFASQLSKLANCHTEMSVLLKRTIGKNSFLRDSRKLVTYTLLNSYKFELFKVWKQKFSSSWYVVRIWMLVQLKHH